MSQSVGSQADRHQWQTVPRAVPIASPGFAADPIPFDRALGNTSARLVLIGSEEDVALRSLRDNPHFFDNSDQPHELEAVVSAKDLEVKEAKEEPVKEKEGDGRPAACPTQGKEAPARVPIAKKPYGLHQGRNPPPAPEPPKKPRNPNSIPWHGLM